MSAGRDGMMPDRGDGACVYLKKNNQCSIYKNRPNFCNIEKVYKYLSNVMTKKEYYIESTKNCHKLIDKFKIDKSYKIELKEYERK